MTNDLTSSAKAPHRISGARRISAFSGTAISTIFAVAAFASLSLPATAQVFWDDDYDAGRRLENQPFESRPFDHSAFGRRHFERSVERASRSTRVKPRRASEPVVKEASKPQGPIIIAISIDQQKMSVYDSNGLYAESPVSTGMRGHSTPMGVFSVIGKEKYHRSNIYSGAPMPYMQRITWSGVAMHAGALPGYPASHGCIRMPMNFAVRMYGWTRQGARVIITPNELSPSDISHPLLFTHKPVAVIAAAVPTIATPKDVASKDVVSTPKSDKASVDQAAMTKDAESGKPELRSTQHGPDNQIVTADASGAVPQKINDAMAESTDAKIADAIDAAAAKSETKLASDVELNKSKDQTRQTADGKPADDKPAATSSTDASKPDGAASDATKPDSPIKPDNAKSDAAKTDKAAAVPPIKPRTGHIAAYVSRKEGKLFVRQNFEPLFEIPVEIVDRDRPLGTHVFTIRADKDNAQAYRWSVVSLPVRASAEPAPRRKKGEPMVQASSMPASSPSDALDRLKIPDEAMQKIAEAIAPGGSITVSDQGLGGETGLGTDFIVPLR